MIRRRRHAEVIDERDSRCKPATGRKQGEHSLGPLSSHFCKCFVGGFVKKDNVGCEEQQEGQANSRRLNDGLYNRGAGREGKAEGGQGKTGNPNTGVRYSMNIQ